VGACAGLSWTVLNVDSPLFGCRRAWRRAVGVGGCTHPELMISLGFFPADAEAHCHYGLMSNREVLRQNSLRVEDSERVQRRPQRPLHVERRLGQLLLQPPRLQPAHVVLAGDGAAGLDGRSEDGVSRTPCPVLAAGGHDQHRVQVAVAGVRDDSDLRALLPCDPTHRLDGLAQSRQRHADVLEQEWAKLLHRRKGRAADVEQSPRFSLVGREGHFVAPAAVPAACTASAVAVVSSP
jgi:hypothetical protein